MIKTIIKNTLVTSASIALLLSAASANSISLTAIEKDINFLASDKLKGRKVFTPELDIAADYIANRFQEAGLEKFNGSYKQTFAIFSFMPSHYKITLNNHELPKENIAIASSAQSFSWDEKSDITQTFINKDDDFRATISQLNIAGGDHLVIVHPKHQPIFSRYKHYFERGLTRLSDKNSGTLVLALSENSQLAHFSVQGKSTITTKALTNVIGVIPGKSKTNELVLYTAHYDHIGEKQTQETSNNSPKDTIYNGADDNASGVSGVLNLAQYFAKQQTNERSLIFVAFTAEEIGGYGSKYFAKHLTADNIVTMINMEMIGKVSKFGAGKLWMTGKERSSLGDIMNAVLKDKKTQIYADPYPEQSLFYRSDNATLARLGVPAHSFSTVQLDKDEHYHNVSDDVSTMNMTSLQQIITTLAYASEPLINGKATPTRVDTTKVNPEGKIF